MKPWEIYALRDIDGLTQSELATRCGVSAKTISRWELGKSKPNETARRLLEMLKIECLNRSVAMCGYIRHISDKYGWKKVPDGIAITVNKKEVCRYVDCW